jgi:dihydroorotase
MVSPGIDVMGMDMARLAIRAARETGTVFMVHIGDTTTSTPSAQAPRITRQVLDLMAPDDIVTHTYTGHPGGMLDEDGNVAQELREAKARGVLLDGGQGPRHLSFNVAKHLLDQDITVDTISTDLTTGCQVEAVYGLTECMSKFMALGLSLEQVVRMTTTNPARALGMSETLGAVVVGREADLSVLETVQGSWEFTDSFGEKIHGDTALVPILTIRGGQVITPDWGPHPWGWLPTPGRKAAFRS